MKFDVLTLIPGFFDSPLSQSVLGRAIERGLIEVRVHNIRDYATDRHRTTDDAPYGGGAGMVMKVEPVVRAIEAVREAGGGEGAGGAKGAGTTEGADGEKAVRQAAGEGGEDNTVVILATPQGARFDHATATRLSGLERLIIVCGRYEGVDERIRAFVDMELSIGDYVLTGGEIPALAVIDAVGRLVPGVLGCGDSAADESFAEGLLEYPQYTRPDEFRGMRVPDELLSGNHAEIERWRRAESIRRTQERRPDLLQGETPAGSGRGQTEK